MTKRETLWADLGGIVRLQGMTDEQKSTVQFDGNWRQVRIFTSDFSEGWYLRLLADVVKPFSEAYPHTMFWFTRYECNINRPERNDQGDTDFSALPITHLAQGENRSVRLRYLPQTDEESFLAGLIKGCLWHSSFLDHDELHEFGGSRFCASSRPVDQTYRANITAKLLYAHSLFVLDCISEENGQLVFEELKDSDRPDMDSFKGIHHLMCNVIGKRLGGGWPTARWCPADNQFYPI